MGSEREWLRLPVPERRTGPAAARMPPEHRASPGSALARRDWRALGRRAGNRLVRRAAGSGAFTASDDIERSVQREQGGGHPLEHGSRGPMESALGMDLGGVRIHDDAGAADLSSQLSARAFTRGQDVYFGAGEYSPGTGAGQHLLAHELAHVAQQEDGAKLEVGAGDDPAEYEADAVADEVVQRLGAPGTSRTGAEPARRETEEEDDDEAVRAVRRQTQPEDELTQA